MVDAHSVAPFAQDSTHATPTDHVRNSDPEGRYFRRLHHASRLPWLRAWPGALLPRVSLITSLPFPSAQSLPIHPISAYSLLRRRPPQVVPDSRTVETSQPEAQLPTTNGATPESLVVQTMPELVRTVKGCLLNAGFSSGDPSILTTPGPANLSMVFAVTSSVAAQYPCRPIVDPPRPSVATPSSQHARAFTICQPLAAPPLPSTAGLPTEPKLRLEAPVDRWVAPEPRPPLSHAPPRLERDGPKRFKAELAVNAVRPVLGDISNAGPTYPIGKSISSSIGKPIYPSGGASTLDRKIGTEPPTPPLSPEPPADDLLALLESVAPPSFGAASKGVPPVDPLFYHPTKGASISLLSELESSDCSDTEELVEEWLDTLAAHLAGKREPNPTASAKVPNVDASLSVPILASESPVTMPGSPTYSPSSPESGDALPFIDYP